MFSDSFLRLRPVFIAILYMGIFALAYVLAFQVRFDFQLTSAYTQLMWTSMPVFVGAHLACFLLFHEMSGWWRYVSLNDMLRVGRATILGTLLSLLCIVGLGLITAYPPYPRSIFLTFPILTIALIGGLRIGIRLFREHSATYAIDTTRPPAVRTLIVGTGPTAEALAREISRRHDLDANVVGFISEDERVLGTRIQGIPIYGCIHDIPKVAEKRRASMVAVAPEGLSSDTMRDIVRLCSANDLKHRVLPDTSALLSGQITLSSLREVDLRDLLGRPPVRLANDEIARHLNTQVVLVTGAGGSIGSELCRQVARFGPAKLVMLEQAENPLFYLERELRELFPSVELHPIIADIYDAERMNQLMKIYHPSMVLHAAAHKHVPLMEANPSEAVKNNTIGTLNVIRAAQNAQVSTCVMISTDKAVNPTSVMGASKRMAEMLMQALASESNTRLAAVRFGNVLGSNGSVIPIFKKQIAQGGPVTVTHPEMRRFFMTIPEATQLVLQAATYAGAGDIFVLDMGEPVYIVDVARDLIRLSGLEPDVDIAIQYIGMRPGEKLFEELSTDTETTSPTAHERIFRCKTTPREPAAVLNAARTLEKDARSGAAPSQIRQALFGMLKAFDEHPQQSVEEPAVDEDVVDVHRLPHSV